MYKECIMKEVFLKIPDKEYNFFMKLIKSLGFVKIESVDNKEDSKETTIKNIKKGFQEMKAIKEGKLETTPANSFLDEL